MTNKEKYQKACPPCSFVGRAKAHLGRSKKWQDYRKKQK